MKTRIQMSIVLMLIVALLASVSNVSAAGYMDGTNWTGIDSIKNTSGNSYLINSSYLWNLFTTTYNATQDAKITNVSAGSNITITWSNGIANISSAGGASGMSNPATANLNMNGYNVSGATNISAKQIGGVIHADQYATIQDAINATDSNNDGYAEYELYIPSGTYNLSTYSTKNNINHALILGSDRAISNLKIRGAGNSTILKYTGADNQEVGVIRQFYEPADVPNVDGSQFDIFISDLTIDLNGKAQFGITLSYIKRATLKNINIMNQNPTQPFTWGIGIYSNNVVLDNIHILPSMKTASSNYSGNELLNTGILFDSLYSYNNIASNIFVTENRSNGLIKSGISFEDDASKITLSNINIDGVNGTGITSAGATTQLKGNLFENIRVINSNQVLTVAPNYDFGIYNNIVGLNSVPSITSKQIYISSSDGIYSNIQITNASREEAGLYVTTTGGYPRSGQNNTFSNVRVSDTNNSYAAVVITDGSNNNILIGGTINNNIGAPFRFLEIGGVRPTNTFASGFTILNNSAVNAIAGSNYVMQNMGINPYNFGNSASAPTAFGAGDPFYNSTANIQQLYTGSIWDWLLMPSKVFGSANVTVTNNNNGSITISSVGASGCSDCPNATVAANLVNWNNTANITYGTGEGKLLLSNGTNTLQTGFYELTPMMTSGIITNMTMITYATGSINVSVTGAGCNEFIAIASGTTATKTGLSCVYTAGTNLNFSIVSADVNRASLSMKYTKTS